MPASVKSFAAIQRLREALIVFNRHAGTGLEEVEAEVRRTLDWVEHDRPQYWKARVHKAHDLVNEAKNALHRCLMYPINDEQPSCTEERAALKRAEAHLEYCRAKQESLGEWSRVLRHEMHEYKGRTAKFRQVLDADAPAAIAALQRALVALEKYATGGPYRGPAEGGESEPEAAPPSAPPEGDA